MALTRPPARSPVAAPHRAQQAAGQLGQGLGQHVHCQQVRVLAAVVAQVVGCEVHGAAVVLQAGGGEQGQAQPPALRALPEVLQPGVCIVVVVPAGCVAWRGRRGERTPPLRGVSAGGRTPSPVAQAAPAAPTHPLGDWYNACTARRSSSSFWASACMWKGRQGAPYPVSRRLARICSVLVAVADAFRRSSPLGDHINFCRKRKRAFLGQYWVPSMHKRAQSKACSLLAHAQCVCACLPPPAGARATCALRKMLACWACTLHTL